MVGSQVKTCSVNDGSLEGNILIWHPIMYFHSCASGKVQMGWYCDVEVNEAH